MMLSPAPGLSSLLRASLLSVDGPLHNATAIDLAAELMRVSANFEAEAERLAKEGATLEHTETSAALAEAIEEGEDLLLARLASPSHIGLEYPEIVEESGIMDKATIASTALLLFALERAGRASHEGGSALLCFGGLNTITAMIVSQATASPQWQRWRAEGEALFLDV